MWYILWKAVVTVLVIYAIINILGKLAVSIFNPEPYNSKDAFVVIKVRNQEKNIEGIIRGVIWQNLKVNRGGYVPNILVVDMGSDDDTEMIAQKLAAQYSFIFYTTEEKFNKMKSAFEK